MAIRGVSLVETEDFIFPEDPGHPQHEDYKRAISKGEQPEQPTVFKIGNLTQADRVELGDMGASPSMHTKTGEMRMNHARVKKAYEVVRRGLKGWDNYIDYDAAAKGAKIPFRTETTQINGEFRVVASDDTMARLRQLDIMTLSGEILDKNGMRSELEKKFDGASLQQGVQNFGIGGVPPAQPNSKPSEDAKDPQSDDSPQQNTGLSPETIPKTDAREGT